MEQQERRRGPILLIFNLASGEVYHGRSSETGFLFSEKTLYFRRLGLGRKFLTEGLVWRRAVRCVERKKTTVGPDCKPDRNLTLLDGRQEILTAVTDLYQNDIF